MLESDVNFKIGQLKKIEKSKLEISEIENQLYFDINGCDNKNDYSLSFITIISFSDLLEFQLNEHIDFLSYVDTSDIVFGKNGIYNLNLDIKMDIIRYLPTRFVLQVSFSDSDDVVGHLEIDFSINK